MTKHHSQEYKWDNYYRKGERREAVLRTLSFCWYVFLAVWITAWAYFTLVVDDGYACETRPITVQAGDTLDGIVREFCSGVVTDALDEVVRAYGTTIHENDTIYLPSNDKCRLLLSDSGQVYEEC